MKRAAQAFGADWLIERLTQLLPGYPRVPVCVALSGGVDSTALLGALAEHRPAGARLRAIHVNHGLHANAGNWARHCRKLAASLDVPVKVLTIEVNRTPGTSVEAEARVARYRALEGELASGEYLLMAHHEDDQLETVLLQLFRGAGLGGLSAMPEIVPLGRGWLARPLLPVCRAALVDFARARHLVWVEDDTNADERFDRNYLRRTVLPLVRARWPGVGRAASRSARHIAQAQTLLTELAQGDVERAAVGPGLSAQVLRRLPPERRSNALRHWIARSGATLPNTARLTELAGPFLASRHEASPVVEWDEVTIRRVKNILSLSRVPGRRRM